MSGYRPKPLGSLHANDPEWEEAIAAFVVSLGERIDAFQDAESGGALETLRGLAATLSDDAHQVGYPSVAEAAQRVRAACDDGAAEARRKAVVDLTEIAQRVRRGHRTAAG